MISTVKQIIEKHDYGYILHFACDGKEACRIASNVKPDLILIDLILPIMDGTRAIRVLKRMTKTHNIPIVVMTSERSLHEAFEAGADDFIYKPFDEAELLFRIRCALTLGQNIKKIKDQNEQLICQSLEMKRQYRLMEEQKKDIIDDITYSRRIQNAILPNKNYLSTLFPEYFLYFKPKRIVSGDFYWITQKREKIILAVADCTGHGISGAFLTIAGTAFLNEIINFVYNDAAEMLNQLRNRIMRLLQQKGVEGEAADGMDISLCIFDFDEMKLQYAGANNQAFLVKANSELHIFAPDKMPIGIHANFNQPFKNHDIPVEKGDMIYMFSDGYADQFGGEHDQKFRNKRLLSLCTNLHSKSMNEQYEIFERTMDEWIGYRDQVDDMLLIGIRI
jgi:serine phosphatase RsbU (regulator of sigma subunit)